MKHIGKILWSLFLVSIFGAKAFLLDDTDPAESEFTQNRLKLHSDTLGDGFWTRKDLIEALKSSIKDLRLEFEASNLISRVEETDRMLNKLVENYITSNSYVGTVCPYGTEAYKALNNSTVSKEMINHGIKFLQKVVNVTSEDAAEAQKSADEGYEKVTKLSSDVLVIGEELRLLVETETKTLVLVSRELPKMAEKFFEDLKAFIEGFTKLLSVFKNWFKADKELINRLRATVETLIIEKVLSQDELEKSEIVSSSDKITSALQKISDVCGNGKN